jgi:phosphate transport system permease protein
MKTKARKAEEALFKGLMVVSLLLILSVLAGIVIVITMKGASSLSWAMLVETPKGGYYLGKGGGIANAIVGSFYLAISATVISILISLPAAFALQQDFSSRKFANFTRLLLDVLWGTPSIVYGAFGFIVMVYFGIRASLLGGIIVLTLLMLPIMIRSMEEVIRTVPLALKETAYALGATRIETTLAVVMRQALPGIMTAVLLAFGRGIGDAASILFTAGYTDYLPRSLFEPVASLPLAVFFQAGTPIPEVQDRAYTAALILLFIVLMVNIVSRILSWRSSKYIIK